MRITACYLGIYSQVSDAIMRACNLLLTSRVNVFGFKLSRVDMGILLFVELDQVIRFAFYLKECVE